MKPALQRSKSARAAASSLDRGFQAVAYRASSGHARSPRTPVGSDTAGERTLLLRLKDLRQYRAQMRKPFSTNGGILNDPRHPLPRRTVTERHRGDLKDRHSP